MNPLDASLPCTFDLALEVVRRLAQAQCATWLHGGWAEELSGLSSPRPHRDVDLLYPAPDFARFDHWLASAPDLLEIPAKRFAHKRAFLRASVMIELLLLEPGADGRYRTRFFEGRYQLLWPAHTLTQACVNGVSVPVASEAALRLYRRRHHLVAQAYQAYARSR